MFFELVRQELLTSGLSSDEQIESIALGDLSLKSVNTQIGNMNDMFSGESIEGRKVISIIISDDKFSRKMKVENDERSARYDGGIFADPGWIFIVENKPLVENIWLRQLNPAFREADVKIIEHVCALSWRNILGKLNRIIQNQTVFGLEKQLIEDFIEYIDHEFSYLNPYMQFDVCKGNEYLLNKRCVALLESLKINEEAATVEYHRGGRHYAKSNKTTVKQIALDASVEEEKWAIHLWLYAGDAMKAAKETYEKLTSEKLLNLKNKGFKLSSNFHVSYRSSNLLWSNGTLTFEEYLQYWKMHAPSLHQVKREGFSELFENLLRNELTAAEDQPRIQEKIMNKNYDRLNICPGFLMKYTWTSVEASDLDRNAAFRTDLIEKVSYAFEALGDEIDIT
ncbi:MAG: hypothetical protein KBT36_04525 [Kurthia sp.]|nr:hypothetical protein [Candidatus Kurthia equi]